LEWVKYSVCTLNKSTVLLVWQEGQSLRLSLSLWGGMECIIALFQERTASGNESWTILSLLFPMFNDSGR
jgi:hypothetical protein